MAEKKDKKSEIGETKDNKAHGSKEKDGKTTKPFLTGRPAG
jgi:hypothetical protein